MLTLNTKLWQRVDTENDDATYLIPQNNIIIVTENYVGEDGNDDDKH